MKTIYTLLLMSFCIVSFGQTSQLKTADRKYEKYSYIDAIEIYEKVAEKGHKSSELFKKLGNSYYFNAELDKAARWYKELFNLNEEVEPEYYFRYAQCLKAINDYENANKYLELFAKNSNDPRGEAFLNNPNYLQQIEENSGKYTLGTTNINSEYADFSPSFFNNQIVFASARKDGAIYSKVHSWTKQNFTDLYVATKNADGSFSPVENFSKEINTKFNESSPVFTKDGKTMYFTRNNFNDGKKGKDDEKTMLLKIYKASLVDGKWTNITDLPFNSDNYQVAHPALSPDEKTLYFASDMPGGLGGSDLYKVSIKEDGTFGNPENLGNIINTPARESFPFVGHDNTLYFASDGHLGLGGLDVFETKLTNGSYSKPQNLGKPINSSMDDFGFIVNDKNVGYLSSNREGGNGFDDIYSFTVCSQKIHGVITDLKTKEILPNAKVELYDEQMKKLSEIFADDKGHYSFTADCNHKYTVRASKEEYESNEKMVTTAKETGETKVDIALERTVFPIDEGTDLAKIFDISMIYFDLDKWNIRPDAAKDLQKIIEVMQQYPNMTVDIRSHTDSRQTHKYNELLSDRRAKSTLEFMVKNGIDRKRLTAKGYGETQLVNGCSDGVPCSEEEHQKNRRSEFIIVKMN
jgi:outer membrane protein OmpA-like peptidoglycan-associated protein/TPR repeat protein